MELRGGLAGGIDTEGLGKRRSGAVFRGGRWWGSKTSPFCFAYLAFFSMAMAYAADPIIVDGPRVSPAPAQVGQAVRFSAQATSVPGDTLRYVWNFGDGVSTAQPSSHAETFHTYTEPGRYGAVLRVLGGDGEASGSVLVEVHTVTAVIPPRNTGPLLLDTARNRIWNVNPDNGTVTCSDAVGLKRLFEKKVGHEPRTLTQDKLGRVWVDVQGDAVIRALDPVTGEILRSLAMPYASRPFGILAADDPAGKPWLYVSLEATGKLVKVDPAGSIAASLDIGPSPRGIAVTGDGKRILVTRFISPRDHGEVAEVDGAAFIKARTFSLAFDPSPPGETNGPGVPNYLSSITITPDGLGAWVPSTKANVTQGMFLNNRPLDFQSTVRTIVSRLDLSANREDGAARFDLDNSEQASAVAFAPLGDLAFVAVQGGNRMDIRDPFNTGSVMVTIPEVGLAPQGVAVDGRNRRVYVHNFMSRTLAVYDYGAFLDSADHQPRRLASIPEVEADSLPAQVLQGKRIFYNPSDLRMSRDGYLACATCHLEGRSDQRVWDFTDRGEGLRRTSSLLGRAGMGMGPVHWSANFDEIQDFENDIRGPFGGTGFLSDAEFHAGTRSKTLGDAKKGLNADLDALAAYVGSLTQVHPSPYRNADGTMTPGALAGQGIFQREDVGCARCHVPPLYTDSRLPTPQDPAPPALLPVDYRTPQGFLVHDVGTLKPSSGKRLGETLQGLDTPTLLGIWEGGPYLHDGSAASLLEVITTANAGDRHGKTSQLTQAEKGDLVAFLQQLDQTGSVPNSARARSDKERGTVYATLAYGPRGPLLSVSGRQDGLPPKVSRLDMRGKTRGEFRMAEFEALSGNQFALRLQPVRGQGVDPEMGLLRIDWGNGRTRELPFRGFP